MEEFYSLKAEALITAKRLGIDANQIHFSRKLEWIVCDGKLALRQAAIDHTSRKITLFIDAMQSRWQHQLQQRTLGVLTECIATLNTCADWNEEDHPRDEDGKFTFGGGTDESGGSVDGIRPTQSVYVPNTPGWNPKEFEVLVNPVRTKEIVGLAQETTLNAVRVFRDPDHNLYVWNASHSTHDFVEAHLGMFDTPDDQRDMWHWKDGHLYSDVVASAGDWDAGSGAYTKETIRAARARVIEWLNEAAAAQKTISRKDWDESEHPRDEDGKFTSGSGSDESSGGRAAAGKPDRDRVVAKDNWRNAPPPKDKDGNPLVDLDGTPAVTNVKGEMLLYHRTSETAAKQIMRDGRFISKENTKEVYFSNHPQGQAEGYGDVLVVVAVKPDKVRLNDAFHKGELYVAIKESDLTAENLIGAGAVDSLINKDGEIVMYHGTSKDAVNDIKKYGLVPHKLPGADRWAELHHMPIDEACFAGDRKLSVYLTPSRRGASAFARLAAEVRHSSPTVIEVHVPGEQLGNLRPDVSGEPDMVYFLGPIKPEWIGKTLRPVGRLQVGVENDQGQTTDNIRAADGQTIYAIIFEDDVTLLAKRWLAREWNEEDHPRDEDGRWTDGGGADESSGSSGGAAHSSLAQEQIHRNPSMAAVKALTKNAEYKQTRFVITNDGDLRVGDAGNFTHNDVNPAYSSSAVVGMIRYFSGEFSYRAIEPYSNLPADHPKLREFERAGIHKAGENRPQQIADGSVVAVATSKLEANTKDVVDVTDYPSEGVVGFLTPAGHALEITTGALHSTVATKSGTDLMSVLGEGTARVYAANGFLGIEIYNKPTQQQIDALARIARAGKYERFSIDATMAPWASGLKTFEGIVTPKAIKEKIDEAFADPRSLHDAGTGADAEFSGSLPTRWSRDTVDVTPGANAFIDVYGGHAAATISVGYSSEGGTWLQKGLTADQLQQQAAEAVKTLGGDRVEFAAVVATNGPQARGKDGTRLALIAGDGHSVKLPAGISSHLDQIGAKYALYHNHPKPYPLSAGDLGWLAQNRNRFESIREDTADQLGGGWSSATINADAARRIGDLDQKIVDLYEKMRYSQEYVHPFDHIAPDLHAKLRFGVEGLKASDPVDVPTFMSAHALNQAMSNAGWIEYKYELSDWQKFWLDTYKNDFAVQLTIAEKEARKVWPK